MNRALSGEEIEDLLDHQVKVISYDEISQYKNIDDLLKPYGRVVILYMSKPQYGHWTLLHKLKGNNIEMFDSYGLVPDDELKFVDKNFRKQSNQLREHLSHLFLNTKYKIHYNDHKLQSLKGGVSTCGRWTCLRALNSNMSIDKFANIVKKEAKEQNITPDELVCEYIQIE